MNACMPRNIYIYVCIYHSFPNLLYRKSERLIGRKNNKSPTKHHWKLIHIWYKRITQMTQSCLCFTAFGDHPTYQLNYFPYGINFHGFYKWIILLKRLTQVHKFLTLSLYSAGHMNTESRQRPPLVWVQSIWVIENLTFMDVLGFSTMKSPAW